MPTELTVFSIDKFLGRITNFADVLVDPGYAKIARDIDWRDSRGAIKGAKAHTKTSAIADPIVSLDVLSSSTLGVSAAHFYSLTTEKKVGGSSGSTWGGTAIPFTKIVNHLVGANGAKMIKWDGTYLDQVGTSVPTNGSFAAAAAGTGSFTVGDWDYVVTFVNREDVEGNHGVAITATAQGASKTHCALTAIPTGSIEEGIKSRRIYRTVTGGATYYLLTTIADNTTTTYTDTTVDGSLGTMSPPLNHDKPQADVTIVERVADRLFAAGSTAYPCRLWYSLPVPYWECWPALYYDDFPTTIKTIKRLGNDLLVVTATGPILFTGLDNPATMTKEELLSTIPGLSPRAIDEYRNEVYWQGPLGIFKTSGVLVTEDSETISELIPLDSSASDMAFDSYGNMFLIMNALSASSELGIPVRATSSLDTYTYSAELGTIVNISSGDNWVFTSELGRVISLGTGIDPATVLVRTLYGDNVIWSTSSQTAYCVIHDPSRRMTYFGLADGVYSAFTGDRGVWTWQSVYSHFGDPVRRKRLEKIRIRLDGTVTVSVYGDEDVLLHSEAITETSMQPHELYVPPASWAYKFSVKLEGAADGLVEPPIVYFYEPERL